MGNRLFRCCLAAGFIASLASVPARAQKSDLDNELKNIPKNGGASVAPAPPVNAPAESGAGPKRIQPAGTYTNLSTGVGFPKRVGDFTRLGVDLYDAAAHDTGASYEKKRNGDRINVITVFSYPMPTQLASGGVAAVFEDAKLAITSRQKDAKLVREQPYRAADGSVGDFAEYEFVMEKGPSVRSRLYLFESRGWLLKFRVTYPQSRAAEGAAEIENFIRTFGARVLRNPVST